MTGIDRVSQVTLWFLLCGLLLIAMGLSDTYRQSLPVSSAAIYLIAGIIVGPQMLALLDWGLNTNAAIIETISETVVLISLFAVGLRMRASFKDVLWRPPVVLATAGMVLTIAMVTGFAWWLSYSLSTALLLAAVLAPTDPVLASDVQLRSPQDRDRLRFTLTAEGGLNDGTAFPFVMLALGLMGSHPLGRYGVRWLAVDVFWSVCAGLMIGWAGGAIFGRLILYLRKERQQGLGMESFLTLGLISLVYGAALAARSYGFLAVFAAGLALRSVERSESKRERLEAAETHTVDTQASGNYLAKAVLDFTLDLERIAELIVMMLIGVLLTPAILSWKNVLAAAFLILIARPLAVYATMSKVAWNSQQLRMIAWFGVRGVGSLYYLAFAITHGKGDPEVSMIADVVLLTITISVLIHGSTATPLMTAYQKARRR
jgi:sodium/hydrogen antiporter